MYNAVKFNTLLRFQFRHQMTLRRGISAQLLLYVRLYSKPDNKLLELSLKVLTASELLNDIIITDAKHICSMVAMIPKKLTLPDLDIEVEHFCMVERPGLDISDLGIPYSVYTDDDNDTNEVE